MGKISRGWLVAAIGALLVAAFAAPANAGVAAREGGESTNGSVYVEKNPPPFRGSLPPTPPKRSSSVVARPAATGGGCIHIADNDYSACISYDATYSRVAGDFYKDGNTWINVTNAKVYFFCNGYSYYQYTVNIDHYGHYPVTYHSVSGSGWCYTAISFYQGSDWQVSGWSPDVYYP